MSRKDMLSVAVVSGQCFIALYVHIQYCLIGADLCLIFC